MVRNKKHDIDLINRAIYDYDNSNLSCGQIRDKYGINLNAFFYHRRKKREDEGFVTTSPFTNTHVSLNPPVYTVPVSSHCDSPSPKPPSKPKSKKKKDNNLDQLYRDIGAVNIDSDKPTKKSNVNSVFAKKQPTKVNPLDYTLAYE